MPRRIVLFVVVSLAIVSLAGCGDDDSNDVGTATTTTVAGTSTDPSGPSTTAAEKALQRGTPLLEDDLTTPSTGGWPQTNELWEVRHDRGGAALKAKTTGPTVWSPEVAAAKGTDVSVIADIRGIATSLSFEDGWGVACRREANTFYSFALRGGGEDGAKPSTNVFDWGIFRYEGGSARRLAGGKVDLGGSLFTVEGVCFDDAGTANLRFLVNGSRVGRAVDTTPLTSTGTGVVFQSNSGSSTLSVSKFNVFAVGPG